ncbi:MAG TPA: copper transporter [Streptosporangiaceae bacterium]|nr:copper transporter [Streptosporangiaceae bacterium]
MIDFRYHLVSIIAVFLALAVGLVVGSTALSGKAEEVLNLAQRSAVSRNNALIKNNEALKNQVNADQAFAQAGSQRLIGGLLTHDKVVLVVAPGANGAVTKGVTAALQQAGATVTGEVDVQSSFLTTSAATETELTTLAHSLAAQAGLAPPVQSQSPVAGQQAAAALLAAALLDPTAGSSRLSATASAAILTGLEQNGFVSANSTPATATQAVLIAPGGPPPQPATSNAVVSALTAQLSAASSGTVMAGAVDSIGTGSTISYESSQPHAVSTVDFADTETGQIIVIQALKNLLDGKAPANYGVDPGAAPSPAPTASPTPSTSLPPTGTSSSTAGTHG